MYAMSVNYISKLHFQYWHFDKQFLSYNDASAMNLFALRDIA